MELFFFEFFYDFFEVVEYFFYVVEGYVIYVVNVEGFFGDVFVVFGKFEVFFVYCVVNVNFFYFFWDNDSCNSGVFVVWFGEDFEVYFFYVFFYYFVFFFVYVELGFFVVYFFNYFENDVEIEYLWEWWS